MSSRLLFSKQLRSNMTDAEQALWYYLRAHRLQGAKFKRQQPIGNYIVDFACFEANLIVEVDGGQHADSETDWERETWLNSQGFRVLRFWNHEVLQQTESVLNIILQALLTQPPLPNPLPRGAREKTDPEHNFESHPLAGMTECKRD